MKKILLVFVAVIALTQSAGIKQLSPSTRVAHGESVEIVNQRLFAHQVLFTSTYDDGSTNLCGGELISSNHVMTAGHCVKGEHRNNQGRMVTYDMTRGTLYFGILNFDDIYKPGTERRNILREHCSLHLGWETRPLYKNDDMALITLPQPVVPVPNRIAVIPLPTQNVCDTNLQGRAVVISGWGLKEDGKLPNALQFVSINVQSCDNYGFSNDDFVCIIGPRHESSCSGDSGGPMIYTDPQGNRCLVGVSSFGIGDCGRRIISSYSRVCKYRQWINGIIANVPARPLFGW